MSQSENNRIKRNSGSRFKAFDRKRKRSEGLDEVEKAKIISNYLPANKSPLLPHKNSKEGSQEQKAMKPGRDFFKLFHDKVKMDQNNGQEETDTEKKGVEGYLEEYEKLRLEYEQEGMSQSSILLLQRIASNINKNPEYPNIDQTPVLKELLEIAKKLMFNDFEVIVWMIWLKLVDFPSEENKVMDFLQIIALCVKQSNNPAPLYFVFEKFYSHNYPNFYARFKNWQKPNINLNSADINKYYKEVTKNFEYKVEKTIKDYNYEVDALEAEHDKRDVHTTTQFGEEKLKVMEEEATKANALLNYGKKKTKPKEDPDNGLNRRSRKAADKALEQINEDLQGPSVVTRNTLKAQNEVKIEKPQASIGSFIIPNFTNKEVSGFMPFQSNEGKGPSISHPIIPSSSFQGSKANFESIFHNLNNQNDDKKDKSGNIQYLPIFINGGSNPNSFEIPSFNINPDMTKAHKTMLKMSPDGSFQSNLPQFSKEKDSQSIIFNNRSGSYETKINGFIGAQGSFFNPNLTKRQSDNNS